MSSDCGGARSLLRRDGTAELVALELVQVSLPSLRSLHAVLVAIVNRHVVRRVRAPPRNDVIFSQNRPIMLALCSMLSCTYYATLPRRVSARGQRVNDEGIYIASLGDQVYELLRTV